MNKFTLLPIALFVGSWGLLSALLLINSAALRDFGIEVVTDLCEQLLAGGAPGLHFYSMNQADSVTRLWKNLSED